MRFVVDEDAALSGRPPHRLAGDQFTSRDAWRVTARTLWNIATARGHEVRWHHNEKTDFPMTTIVPPNGAEPNVIADSIPLTSAKIEVIVENSALAGVYNDLEITESYTGSN